MCLFEKSLFNFLLNFFFTKSLLKYTCILKKIKWENTEKSEVLNNGT